jgi:hypothetical protein
VTGSKEFVIDPELADEVEVSPHIEQRYVMRSERSVKNGAVKE